MPPLPPEQEHDADCYLSHDRYRSDHWRSARGWPFGASTLDLGAFGYTEAAYYLEGTATRYRLADGAELSRDGRWNVVTAGETPHRTRKLVLKCGAASGLGGTSIRRTSGTPPSILIMWSLAGTL